MNMPFEMSVGSVGVKTTNNRGFTPEEVSELCVDRLMICLLYTSDAADE